MSEAKNPERGDDAATEAKLAEIVRKAASEAVEGLPSIEDIAAKVKEMLPEPITMDQVKEALDEYAKSKESDDKPEEKEETKPIDGEEMKDETKPIDGEGKSDDSKSEDAKSESAKTGDHLEKLEKQVAELRDGMKQFAELREGVEKVAKVVEKQKDEARRAKASGGIPTIFKSGHFLVGNKSDAPNALMHKSIPTRVGMGEHFGFPLYPHGANETKASTLATADVAGAAVVGTPVWRNLLEEVRIANLLAPLKIDKGGKFKLVQLVDKTLPSRTTVNPATAPTADANSITETEHEIKEFGDSYPISFAQDEDVDGIPEQIEIGFMQQYGNRLDEEAFTQLKAASGAKTVQTGTANQLPAADAVYTKLLELRKTVGLAYRANGVFVLNTDIEDLLLQNFRSGSGFAFNPFEQGDLSQMLGAPVVVSSRLDDTSTPANGEICAMYGDFASAGTLGERVELEIWLDASTPAYRLWHARGRFGVGVKSTNAYAMLRVGA